MGRAAGVGSGALSGAGSGALIGSAVPGIGTAIGAGAGALAGGLAGWFGSSGNDDQEEYQRQLAAQRAQSKAAQYGYLDQMQGPQVTDATRRRIAALQDQSKASSLVEDPYFQGQRAQLVQGGQQALSSVDNAHNTYGTTGGFSNQGSQHDVMDRLSGQLSQLGQQSVALKDQKANQAAQMEQGIVDAQTAFKDAQLRARMAIESGDSAAASEAINQAFQAKQKMNESNRSAMGSALGGVAQAAGTYAGANKYNPNTSGGDAYAHSGANSGLASDSFDNWNSAPQQLDQNMPWSQKRRMNA